VLEKIEQMVAQGGTVVGPRPQRAVGLEGYPASDAKVKEIAGRLWGDLDGKANTSRAHGKGRVVWGKPLRAVMGEMRIGPDFKAPAELDFIHRRDGATDIYFVRNTTDRAVSAAPVFRATGRQPELWNAVTGGIRTAPAWTAREGGTEVPLTLDANGSVFVIFRRMGEATRMAPPVETEASSLPVGAPWRVEFEGRTEPVVMQSLDSWTSHSDPRVKYYPGTARYHATFDVPVGWRNRSQPERISLGNLWTIGEVWLNGKSLGVSWTRPFEVDAMHALREGRNELVVEVTGTWFNRLVGDAKLPPGERTTRTNVTTSGHRPWAQHEPVPAGLFGPVRVVRGRP
jgi:hypothetical protein